MNPMPLRDGFALPAALLAMIVIGAIVTGGFYVSSQEHKVSVSTDLGAQAMLIAETGLQEQLATVTTNTMRPLVEDLQQGTIIELASATVFNGSRPVGEYRVRAMSMGGQLYLFESEGTVERGQHQATRRVAFMVRTNRLRAPFQSAVTTLNPFHVGGNSVVSGTDFCDNANQLPGVTSNDTSQVTWNRDMNVEGNPEKLEVDASVLNEETLSDFGDLDLDELIAAATLHYTAPEGGVSEPTVMQPATATSGGQTVCDPFPQAELGGAGDNWGENLPPGYSDHVAECADHYPIIYSDGPLDLTTGRGQGILIVDGDLTIDGNFNFDGVVIVRDGKFRMAGTGGGGDSGKINGTVIVMGEDAHIEVEPDPDDPEGTSGNARIQWDSCAVEDALSALRLRPFAGRSWLSDIPPLP